MNLQDFLNEKVMELGIEDTARALGYKDLNKGVSHIEYLLSEPYCAIVNEEKNFYDWTYTDATLLKALCVYFQAPQQLLDANENAVEYIKAEQKAANYMYIHIITKGTYLGSYQAAMWYYSYFGRITKLSHLYPLSFDQKTAKVEEICRRHYFKHKDKLRETDAILRYEFYYEEFKDPYIVDPTTFQEIDSTNDNDENVRD